MLNKEKTELKTADLEGVCSYIRSRILEVVSKNGGHLSSALGAVEIIVAMHYVFDYTENPFIFDVSHQAYAHKILTQRDEKFDTLRQMGGISGFTNPKESEADYFIAGHSSTSISLGVGVAKSFALRNKDSMPIVLIGDGSMSAGLAYEALNELGDRKFPMLIILNDNEMSIAKPIGAISRYLSGLMSGSFYQGFREQIKKFFLSKMPESATYLAKRFEESFKLITPGILFEELGIHYMGPIDGHNLSSLISAMQKAREMKAPVLIHAQTTKGKGYGLAEGFLEKWHGVSPFDLETGQPVKKSSQHQSPTQVYADELGQLCQRDESIVGVTAAMPGGTGLSDLMEKYPHRFFDVGIAEQHAVTSMAALAKEGFKPFVTIYSTFLQRGYDQIIHDVGIMSLPVKFAIDRAGIVGEDGETHQGLFDIAFLRVIPHFVLFAPRDNETLREAIRFSLMIQDAPCAFRYPRGEFALEEGLYPAKHFEMSKSEWLQKGDTSGNGILLVGYGNGVGRAEKIRQKLLEIDVQAGLLDLRFIKPLDIKILEIFKKYCQIYVFSDSYLLGGVGSALLELMMLHQVKLPLYSFEIKDEFIPHGNVKEIEQLLGFDQIIDKIKVDLNLKNG